MRAREPDETGFVERDGVPIYWERFGDGSPTLVLMPLGDRALALLEGAGALPRPPRRVVVYDRRGNGARGGPPTSRLSRNASTQPTPSP